MGTVHLDDSEVHSKAGSEKIYTIPDLKMLKLDNILSAFLVYASLMIVKGQENCSKEKIIEAGLIPTYADDVESTDLEVTYKIEEKVDCGNFLAFVTTLLKPTVKFDLKESCENATVLFTGIPTNFFDLDALVGFPFLHWLYVNVKSSNLANGWSAESGDRIASYLPPLSPTRDHRYTFFIYCQENYIQTNGSEPGLLERRSFDIKKFAEQNELGDPKAINFFNSALTNLPEPDLSNISPPVTPSVLDEILNQLNL